MTLQGHNSTQEIEQVNDLAVFNSTKIIFTQEALDNISSLGETLRRIQNRLLATGVFEIVDRKLVKKCYNENK